MLRGLPVDALSYTPCRGGVATGVSRNCCKMRCQTSHLTMQTSKWAAVRLCLFICLRPPSLYHPSFHSVCTLSICPSVCLSVGLFVCWSVWPCVCLAVSQNGWAQGSRMLSMSKLALHLCVFLEDAAGCCCCC